MFLSLTLVLILALVGTTIESARVYSGKSVAERTMVTAMESVLSEYYYPLYQDYHLFLLDGGYGEESMQVDLLKDITTEYLYASLDPDAESQGKSKSELVPRIQLHDGINMNISIEDIVGLLDYEYKPFIHEVVGYMKYKTPTQVLELSGEFNTYSRESAKYAEVMEKKIELEEITCKLSESMLDLIRNIEGIKVDKKGIHYTKSNLIKTEKNFVKKFLVTNRDSKSVGISNEVVYYSLKEQYQHPIVWIDSIIREEEAIITYMDRIKTLYEELTNLDSYDDDEDDEEAIERSKEINKRKNEIWKSIEELERNKLSSLNQVKSTVNQLVRLTKGTEEKIEEALKIIPKVSIHQKESIEKCKEYDIYLNSSKGYIDKEMYSNLQSDKDKIEDYIQRLGNDTKYNLSEDRLININQTLLYNKEVLSVVYSIEDIPISFSRSDISRMIECSNNIKNRISQYEIKELWFDYSSLVIDPEVKNPITSFSECVEKGILSLVVDDTNNISNKTLINADSPSKIIEGVIYEKEADLSEGINDYDKNGEHRRIKDGLGEYGKRGEISAIESVDSLIQTALFHEYILTHFKRYKNVHNVIDSEEKDTSLEYEQEYMIFGGKSDYSNLSDMINRLLLTRTVANFSYLYVDEEKSNLAYATAAALVGFTCLEPLVNITKAIILLAWAYAEALVDVRGLLDNRYVPFVKNKKNFQVRYVDLLVMNKGLIQQKSNQFSLTKISIKELCYEDYIKIYLYLTNRDKLCLRTLDLIQENINLRYKDKFIIKNGIFGYKIKGEFQMDAKLIKLPFVKKVLESDIAGYRYTIIKDNSY